MQYCTRPTRALIMTKNHISETLHIITCVRVCASVIRVSLKCKKTFYLLQARFERCDFIDFGRRPRNTECLKNSYRLIVCKPIPRTLVTNKLINYSGKMSTFGRESEIFNSIFSATHYLVRYEGRYNRLTKIIF